jgi:hypothetical protein
MACSASSLGNLVRTRSPNECCSHDDPFDGGGCDTDRMTELDIASALATIEARNPADGTRVGEVPNDSAESVAAKGRELRRFQPEREALGAKGLTDSRPEAITALPIPALSAELLWYPYSRRKFRLAMGAVQAAAADGLRRVGLKPWGSAR